jgi:D-alanyl-D-alanine carboxypeptidase (penicillin-binding protein 5/6)
MLPKFKHLLVVCVIGIVIYGGFVFTHADSQEKPIPYASPLPAQLSKSYKDYPTSAKYFKPSVSSILTRDGLKPIDLSAQAGIAYDLTTHQVLYAKNITKQMPIASLTKIMTAIVALENEDPNQQISISKDAANIGEDSMGLSEGESLSLHDLLYGLVLHSGNDAAEAIADASPYGRDNFVYIMNKEAEELGLTNTHFTNPTGLQGDGKQYSTAYDLLVMTKYALDMPLFKQVAATVHYDIYSTEHNKAYHLDNETNLLTSYPGVKGVKTGFTDEAGLCLVTYLEHDGHRIIAVLLNSPDRRQEMKDLLDYSLKDLGDTPPPHS